MHERTWSLGVLIVLMILFGTLVAVWIYPPMVDSHPFAQRIKENHYPTETVTAYLPTWAGAKYEFIGEGMEYATFTREITYATSDLLQVEDLSGTNVVSIMEITPFELRIVWRGEEFYEKQSLLEPWVKKEYTSLTGREESLVPLKAPLLVGETWSDSGFEREIYQIRRLVSVPLGTFSDVVVVKSRPLTGSGTYYDYYAKNIGLIKQISQYDTFTVTSALAQLEVANPDVHSRD